MYVSLLSEEPNYRIRRYERKPYQLIILSQVSTSYGIIRVFPSRLHVSLRVVDSAIDLAYHQTLCEYTRMYQCLALWMLLLFFCLFSLECGSSYFQFRFHFTIVNPTVRMACTGVKFSQRYFSKIMGRFVNKM